jgi:hypothetical protein
MKLPTHLHLVPRLKYGVAIPAHLHTSSWHPGITLTFTFTLDLTFRTHHVGALFSGMLGRADEFAVHDCVLYPDGHKKKLHDSNVSFSSQFVYALSDQSTNSIKNIQLIVR